MNDFTVWSGAYVSNVVVQGDPNSVSASIVRIAQDTGIESKTTANFETIEGKIVADVSFTASEVNTTTKYDYYVTENFDDGAPMIYPDPKNCSGDNCELPIMTVCPLPEEGS